MTTRDMQRTAVGVFEDRTKAQHAIQELKRMGFTDQQIGVASQGEHKNELVHANHDEHGNHAGAGAAAGVAGGLGVGALWGLGIIAGVLPAIGPVIAGGVLASIAASAAAGAAAGGLVGALVGMGVPNDEAEYYENEFRQGRTIVTVQSGDRFDEVRGVMRRFGAYDMSNRHEARETTAAPIMQNRTAATQDRASLGNRAGLATERDSTHMELREERLTPHKETTRQGEVHVRKEVVTERQTVEVPVEREEVVIERHPTAPHHATGAVGATEEIRIPVKEEHAHVEKETVSLGEVDVKKRTVRDVERVEDTVRKEQLRVDTEGQANVRDASCDTDLRGKNNRS
ncbi:MAG TPA: YsnF/AvaK domain-containing protein [Pirellulaceae bacterium]|nr:YsnF/AvaK domain-containing protein [Pirellulaceae bacterium]